MPEVIDERFCLFDFQVGGTASMPSSADPDDGFQGIAFPQEVAMQKVAT